MAALALAAGSISADPSSIEFGSQDVFDGPTATEVSTITNAGPDPVEINSVELQGLDTDQFVVDAQPGDCDGSTELAVGESCDVHVYFNPTATGEKSATLRVIPLEDDSADIPLTGTGTTTDLTATPTSHDLGPQDIDDGPTATDSFLIENTGSEPVSVDAVTLGGADAAEFLVEDDAGGDCQPPHTLNAGDSCNVRVSFDPTTTGAKEATVTVASDVLADIVLDLDGTGIQTELTATPPSDDFGSQDVDDGETDPTTFSIANTGTETVTFTGITVDAGWVRKTGAGNDCALNETLTPSEACDLRIAFDPSATGPQNGLATIDSNAPPLTIALDGTGTQTELSRSPATLNFGSHDIEGGPTATQESTVTNSGTEQVSIVAVDETGDTGQFERLTTLASDCSGTTTLNAGETCEVRVRFDPTTTGAKSATYTVDSNADDVTVTASGTGTLTELTADPTALPFGSQDVDDGETAPQTSLVENTGDQNVTIAALTLGGANPKQFRILGGTPTDCAVSQTLAPGEDCDLRIAFDPSFKGAKAATATVDSNAPDATVSLSGTATESVYESSDDALDEAHVTNGQVNAVAFDSAGRTYLGGTFTHVGPRTGHGVRLTEDSDEPASTFPDVDGTIRAVAPDGSGGWFIAGDFMTVDGTPRQRLAHLTSTGALDTTWDPAANGRVNALVVEGGNVFAGGEFATVDGVQRAFVVKLSASTGVVDATWHPIVDNRVLALAVNGSSLYLGGDFTQIDGEDRNRVARVSTAGAGPVDLAWNPDANGSVASLAISGSDVYAGGAFTNIGGEARDRIAKLSDTSGAAITAFNPGANNTVSTLAVSGTALFAGGSFTTIGGQPRNRLARLATADGTVNGTFDANADAPVLALAVDGIDLYAAGEFTQIGGESRSRLARVSSNSGGADQWDPSANGVARALAHAGTDVYAGGDFTSVGATARNRLARLEPDGTLDADWDPDANNTVSALAISGSDVYAGGSFTTVGGEARARLVKLSTASDTPDATWDPGATGTVSALAATGTTVYAGGLFLTIDGTSRSRLARLTGAAGDLDATWLPAGAGGQVNALALSGTTLFAGGAFTTIGGATRQRIAKLDSGGTGAVDSGWDPGASNTVAALAVSGTDLFAGGFFTTIGSQPRNFAAKLATGDGTVDATWNPDPNSVVRALALSPDSAYLGGEFTQVGGRPHNGLAKVSRSGAGAADSGWDPAIAGGTVNALAISGDRLATGGSFTSVGGQSSQGFALLELPTLTSAPGGLHFGTHDVDDPATAIQTATITNPRAQTLTLDSVTLGGADAAHFQHLTDDPGDCAEDQVLVEDATCTVRVRFDPTSSGPKAAAVSIVSDSPGIQVALTGTGVDTALAADPATLPFGGRDIDDGPTTEQTSTVTNAGTEQVDFSALTLGGADAGQFVLDSDEVGDCTATTILQPTQSCDVRVTFDPTTTGAKAASITIESSAEDDVTIALSGTGQQTLLTRDNATLPFGSRDIDDGPSTTQTSTITNAGSETVTLTGVDTTGDSAHFVRLTNAGSDCAVGTVLDAAETCEVREQFDPTTVGAKSATVTVTSNAADVTVALSGTGIQTELTAVPDTHAHGARDIDNGPTSTEQSTVTNTGTETVTIAGVTIDGADAGHFTRTEQSLTDCQAATELDPGETCNVRTQFDPTTVGAKSATVTIDSNALDETIALSGTGTQTELSVAPDSQAHGSRDIDDGPTTTQTSTVTNTGTEPVDLDAVTLGGTDPGQFVHLTDQGTDCDADTVLTAGQTCAVRIRFDPSTFGAKSATVTVDSNAADVTVALSGTGIQTQLTAAPGTLGFGTQHLSDGPTATQVSTVGNTGTESVDLDAVTLGGTDPTQFERLTGQGTDCSSDTVLAAGASCEVRARFDPTTTGAKSATITLDSNAPDEVVALTGNGTEAALTATPASLSFGPKDVDENETADQTSVIENTGTETVTFTGITVDAGWVRKTGESADCALDETLAPSEECDLRIAFDPWATGAQNGQAVIASNAPNEVVTLSGTGTQTELSRSPATLSFGSQDVNEGATATQESTVTNSGTEPVSLVAVNGSGDASQFERLTTLSSDCDATTTLDANETCKVRVRFDPTTIGAKSATYTVDSNAADVTIGVDGTATLKELTPDPATLALGSRDIDDGPGTAQTSVVENTGDQPVTIAGVAMTGDTGHFTRLTTEDEDCSAGDVLAPDDTCDVRAEFDPTTVGGKSATITIDSNGPDAMVGLTGTGTQTELSRSPTTLSFGSRDIDDGPTDAQESTVTNSGTETVDLDAVTFGGTDPGQFAQLTGEGSDCTAATTLTAGQTCKVRVRFDPTAMGAKSATVTVESNADDVSVGLSGSGIQTELSRSPASLSFGAKDIDDAATATQTSTVTNSGSETVDLDAVTVTGDSAQFERLTDQGTDCTAATTLTANQTCNVRVRFDPSTTGAKAATFTVESNAADVTVGVSGTGIQTELSRSPASLSFGSRDIDDGETAAQTSVIENTGTETVTFTGITVDAGWVRKTGAAEDCALTQTLTPGQDCDLRIAFDPSSTGAASGQAVVASNAPSTSVALGGTGIQTLLTRDPATLALGSRDIDDGPSTTQTSTITNAGSETVTLTGVNTSGDSGDFVRLTSAGSDCAVGTVLEAAETCEVREQFDPASVGAKSATVTVTSNAADVTVGLTGTGIQTLLSRAPTTLSFGDRDIDEGPTALQESTVTNVGTEPVDLDGVTVGGAGAGHFERPSDQGTDCTASTVLDAGETCEVRVRFDPSTVGAKAGTVTVDSNAADVTVAVDGDGIQTLLSRSPASVDFGGQDIDLGPTAAQGSTVTNAGTEPVTLAGVSVNGPDAARFERVTDPATDCAAGDTLLAGETCKVRARFDPTEMGARSATIDVDAQAPAEDVSVALAATGTQNELSRSASDLAFGGRDVDDGPSAAQGATVTNTGSDPVTINGVSLGGDAGEFVRVAEAEDCAVGQTLAAGQTCALRARFDPSTTGAKAATMRLDSTTEFLTVALAGTGTQTALVMAPPAHGFGALNVGEGLSPPRSSTVRNVGTEPVAIGGVALGGPGAAQFALQGGAAGDCAGGATLPAGATCAVRTAFDPSSTGDFAALVTVTSNAAPVSSALTGLGTATRLVLGSGPRRASQTRRRRFRVQLSVRGGSAERVTLTLSTARGRRIKRVQLRDVSATRRVVFRLSRRLPRGRYVVTAEAPAADQIGPARRVYRLR